MRKITLTLAQKVKRALICICLLVIGFLLPANASGANAESPIMTMKAQAESLQFVVVSETESGVLGVDFGDGNLVDFRIEKGDTVLVEGALLPNKEIKVYGSPTLVTYFSCINFNLTELDLTGCKNLLYLVCQHNLITSLNLKGNDSLGYLDCRDNQLTELDISENPELVYLYAETNTKLGNIDFSNNPKLKTVAIYGCEKITSVNVSVLPQLQRLGIDQTGVSTVDVSQNPELQILNVGYTKINRIDVSNNPKLRELYISQRPDSYYKHKSVDVSNNPELIYLFVSGNDLTELDISHNPKLFSLYASDCKLSSLDISNNPELVELVIRNNYFTFNTLPIPTEKMTYYQWAPQAPISVEREYAVGSTLDLTEEVYNPDYQIKFDLFLTDSDNPDNIDVNLEEGIDYTFDKGTVTFLKAQPDSVYCQILHEAFEKMWLTTTKFLVREPEEMGTSSLALEFTTKKEVGEVIYMRMSAFAANSKIEIDFGDGERKEYTITSYINPYGGTISDKLKGNTVKVYTGSGVQLQAIEIPDAGLTSIDLSNSHALRNLTISGNALTELDLSKNRELRTVVLDNNQLTELEFAHCLELYSITCNNNLLENLSFDRQCGNVKTLKCSYNKLKNIDLSTLASLQILECNNNQLETLDVSANTELTDLRLQDNNLRNLNLAKNEKLSIVWIKENHFMFSTMPETVSNVFSYGGQKNVEIAKTAKFIDLSSEAVIKGFETVYVWKTESGMKLFEGEEYTIENGVTTFLDYDFDGVYCEMTNEAWPDLTLKTTVVKPSELPSVMLAQLDVREEPGTPVELRLAAEEPGYVYIDYGDGTLQECKLETTFGVYSSTVGDSQSIKIYGYSETDCRLTVLSIPNMALQNIDISKLDALSTLNLHGAGLKEIDLSHNPNIEELTLSNNRLTSLDLTLFPKLRTLNLSNNRLTQLDLSINKNLTVASFGGNKLESIDLSNLEKLQQLSVSENLLTELDITGNPKLREINCEGNALTHLDISSQETIISLSLRNNLFSFSTLPLTSCKYYTYAPQGKMNVEMTGGKIDLSSESNIGGMATTFAWYTASGKKLTENTDYSIDNGITEFLLPQDEKVYCTMNNETFPGLTLQTSLVDVNHSNINSLETAVAITVCGRNINVNTETAGQVNVYGIAGTLLRSESVSSGKSSIEELAPGIYVVEFCNATTREIIKISVK